MQTESKLKPRRKYLNNRDLLAEIHRSKTTFCWFADPAFADFDEIVSSVELVTQPGRRYRVPSAAHIPETDIPRQRSKSPLMGGRLRVNFPPFSHWILGEDGQPVEVGRSHWRGDLETGAFCQTHGRVTDKLAQMFMALAAGYTKRPNLKHYSYRDEFEANAIMCLVSDGLKFDESRGSKPSIAHSHHHFRTGDQAQETFMTEYRVAMLASGRQPTSNDFTTIRDPNSPADRSIPIGPVTLTEARAIAEKTDASGLVPWFQSTEDRSILSAEAVLS